jgi:hypothetical protein
MKELVKLLEMEISRINQEQGLLCRWKQRGLLQPEPIRQDCLELAIQVVKKN